MRRSYLWFIAIGLFLPGPFEIDRQLLDCALEGSIVCETFLLERLRPFLLGLLELPRQGAEEDVRALCAQRVVELRPAREQAEEPQ